MVNLELIGLGARVISNMAIGTFFGGALYITAVECPARKAMGNAILMLDNWQETFSRAKAMLSKVMMFAGSSGLLGWYTDPSPQRWLVLLSSVLMLSILPWTIVGIAPTNSALLDYDGAKKKGDEWIKAKMDKWMKTHTVRTLLSGTAMIVSGIYWADKAHPFL